MYVLSVQTAKHYNVHCSINNRTGKVTSSLGAVQCSVHRSKT